MNPQWTKPISNPTATRTGPLWKGPEVDGITYSMLSQFLTCRERFRVLVVEGLKPAEAFNHKLAYGSMFHRCDEAYSSGSKARRWENELKEMASEMCRDYPFQQDQVEHWYEVCKAQFPEYVNYWSTHETTVRTTPLLQEQVFDVPYKLPSGRTVRLRGRWDGVELMSGSIYLVESKTKGDVRVEQIIRQLSYDLQSMLYLVALSHPDNPEFPKPIGTVGYTIKGVRYNVVRRPLSGGKGTIVRHKPTAKNPDGESKDAYYKRLRGIIADSPDEYFFRFGAEVKPTDIANFRRECLDPILEQLCYWWDQVNPKSVGVDEIDPKCLHYRMPYGTYSPIMEGGTHPLDEYLASGSTAGLQQTTLFKELQ